MTTVSHTQYIQIHLHQHILSIPSTHTVRLLLTTLICILDYYNNLLTELPASAFAPFNIFST